MIEGFPDVVNREHPAIVVFHELLEPGEHLPRVASFPESVAAIQELLLEDRRYSVVQRLGDNAIPDFAELQSSRSSAWFFDSSAPCAIGPIRAVGYGLREDRGLLANFFRRDLVVSQSAKPRALPAFTTELHERVKEVITAADCSDIQRPADWLLGLCFLGLLFPKLVSGSPFRARTS